MNTPLGDLRVLEISDRIAGFYCGKMLRDAGALVTLVEPAGRSPARTPLFHFLNGGKRSVMVGQEELAVLEEQSDVVIVTGTPDEARAGGIAVDQLRESTERNILVTISDFGWTGPWAERLATEFTLQALCGATGYRGTPERPPVAVGGQLGEYVSGAFGATGALALWRRLVKGGPGGHLDVSMLECMTLAMQSYEWLHATLMQLDSYARSIEVPSIEPAKDGWVGMSLLTGQQWRDFATMIGQPALGEDPELSVQLGRWPRRRELYELIHPWLAEHTVEEVVELASLFRLPVAPLGNGATIATMDHFAARGVFRVSPSGWSQPRPPWLMSVADPAPPQPAPATGEHTGEALAEARSARSARSRRRPAPTVDAASPPLAGLRVVDLTAFWAGPAATSLLAGFGADVVKIESIQRPDGIRFAGGQRQDAERWWEYSWVFHGVNVDKRSVTLDLGSQEGRQALLDLVAGADVVIENFSPRVLDDFDLGPDVLRAANPAVIVVRMPAFGLDGPWRDRVGFAPTMEQLSGLAWLTGYPDGPPIAPRGACDPLAGAHATFAVLAALACRDRVSSGMLVEVPMIEVALNVTAEQMLEYQRTGDVLVREGNRGPNAAPQNVYACAGEEAWVALAVSNDQQWEALRNALGQPLWAADPELSSHQGRRHDQDRIDRELAEWFATQEASDVVSRLWEAGVPISPVILPPDVVSNEQLRSRQFFEELEHPLAGCDLYAGLPFGRPDFARRWWRSHPPLLGEHNQEVLGGELGRSASELKEWREKGVIGDRPLGL